MPTIELTNKEPLSTDIRKKTSRWMVGIVIGLTTYLGLMTLTTALHITADLAGWLLVALAVGSALSALVISGVVILAVSDFQDSRSTDHFKKYPFKRGMERSQRVA